MTLRQRILLRLYPLIMQLSKKRAKKLAGPGSTTPLVSFYDLKAPVLHSGLIDFNMLKGKKVLIVNTASDCGFTAQYAELQALYEEQSHRLHILGFPSNDFGNQEKGYDVQIIQFCKDNFGVSFPITLKSHVKKGPDQNSVFQWLSRKELNGWNDQAPSWNFCKYLINEKGELTHFFDSSVSPVSKEFKKAIES
ncbi:MAG TPA: glutathione peroxidase [Flavisolibacter sp.]|nr:glutathione peroxidase [Flavisolibacter sp.]